MQLYDKNEELSRKANQIIEQLKGDRFTINWNMHSITQVLSRHATERTIRAGVRIGMNVEIEQTHNCQIIHMKGRV